ncbi:organomercurial lyase [Actinophytocola sp. NPDC049390]|uniref:organomercurial lyase n=1 Tax=Actinophytocola sp. NPDC049390 TaxID=3363894 RepID=UPI0037AAB09D
MTSTSPRHAIAELTKPGGALDLGHDQARLLIRMFHLLVEGQPVSREHALNATAELGIDRTRVDALLDTWTERDNAGAIVGLGITHNPTAHQMTINGKRMWAWCGMDTLIFAHILRQPITIESTPPDSGEVVRLQAGPSGVTAVTPVEAVVTQRVPSSDQVDLSSTAAIWGTFCHHNLFFPHRAHAKQWAAGRDNHGTDIVVMSIEDGYVVAREMAAALLRYEPGVA